MATSPNQGNAGNTAYGTTGASSGAASSTGTTYTSDMDTGAESRTRDLALQAKEKAREVVEPYAERARSGIEDTMARAASELGTVANALRACGSDMNTRENAMILPYVEQVADQVDRLSSFLETRRIDDLARDAEAFARRNPAVFLGACFGVGILAARFLKSRQDGLSPRYTDTGYNTSGGYNTARSYQTYDNRSASTDGGWVAYGEARYTEPASGGYTAGANDRSGYDAQRPSVDSGISGTGGAAYSGGFRGTEGTTDRTVDNSSTRNTSGTDSNR